MSAPLLQILQNDQLLAQNVQPRATAPGVVQDSSPSGLGGGGPPGSLLGGFLMPALMLVIFVPFFLLTSRRQKKETRARESLRRGDRVMSTSGLIGELVEKDERVAKVKISPSVTVSMLVSSISPYVDEKSPPKELKEAKVAADKK